MSGALSSGIAALVHGAGVSPFPTMNDLLAPQVLNERRAANERNALLSQQELDLKQLEYGLKMQDYASGRDAVKAALASLNGGAPTAPASAYGDTPSLGTGGPGASVKMPPEYQAFYDEASKRTGIPADVLIAQHRQESGFNAGATGSAGEIGIGQIKPSTARDPGYGLTGIRNPDTLRDPRTNINFSADYLKARAGGNIDWNDPAQVAAALRAYNGGGDPNYAQNVMRYLPENYGKKTEVANAPGQHVPAPTIPVPGSATAAAAPPAPTNPTPGVTDLNGPRPLPPIGPQSPVVTPASLANTAVPVNGLLGGGVAARTGGTDVAGPGAGPPPPAPAQAPVAAPAAPQQPPAAPAAAPAAALAPPPQLGPAGLTQGQVQNFTTQLIAARTQQDVHGVMQAIEAAKNRNQQEARQYQQDVRQQRLDAATEANRGVPPGYRKTTSGDLEPIPGGPADPAKGGPIGSQGIEAAHENTLLKLGPKIKDGSATADEKAAYATSYYALQQSGGQTVTITDPNNPAQTVPATIARRLPASFPEPEGGALPPVMTTPGASKKDAMTEGQGQAAAFADRMQVALPLMEKLDPSTSLLERGREKLGKYIGYNVNSPEYQQLRTAQEAFLAGILRKESGAAVSQSEWDRYAQLYFPTPGDSAETVRLKKQFRDTAMQGMVREAGPGYKSATPAPASDSQAAAPKAGDVQDGYRFKGGNPADPKSWEKAS